MLKFCQKKDADLNFFFNFYPEKFQDLSLVKSVKTLRTLAEKQAFSKNSIKVHNF